MNIRLQSRTYIALSTLLLTICVCDLAYAQKGKKPPGNDPPPNQPAIRYGMDLVPIPDGGSFVYHSLRDLNSWRMAVGYFRDASGLENAFLYQVDTGWFCDMNTQPDLLMQLPAELSGYRFLRANAINDAGALVGSLWNDATQSSRGFAIDTKLQPDVGQWVVHALPDVGDASYSYSVDVNLSGDIVARYNRLDGTRDLFIHNPFADPPQIPRTFGISSTALAGLANINDVGEVAYSFYSAGPVYLVDTTTPIPTTMGFWDLGQIRDFISLNNAGKIAAIRAYQQMGGKGKRSDMLVVIDGTTGSSETLLTSSSSPLWPRGHHFMNSSGDIAVSVGGSNDKARLIHSGFSSNPTSQGWNLEDLIDDPLSSEWTANDFGREVWALSDRSDSEDASGYPVMGGTFIGSDGVTRCIVLTPFDVP